jgi:DUF4097 and DUF4098 domain-containing protein YvlB
MRRFATLTATLAFALSAFAVMPDRALAQGPQTAERRIAASARVSVTNPNGSVTVIGSDGDLIRVVARSEHELDPRPVSIDGDPAGNTVSVRSDGVDVALEVTLPRSVAYLSVDVHSGDASVDGVSGEVRLRCDSGDVAVRNTGKTAVFTGSGSTRVESAAGDLYVEAGSGDIVASKIDGNLAFKSGSGDIVATAIAGSIRGELASGDLTVREAAGAVRVDSISGTVLLEQVGGVAVHSASGDIHISGSKGDCDAKTASGSVHFSGAISPDYTYRLQSMSGDVVMRLCGEVPGFRARLASYTGEIETSFPLSIDGPVNTLVKKLEGRYGDGRVQIQLEAFSGAVKLLGCTGNTEDE